MEKEKILTVVFMTIVSIACTFEGTCSKLTLALLM